MLVDIERLTVFDALTLNDAAVEADSEGEPITLADDDALEVAAILKDIVAVAEADTEEVTDPEMLGEAAMVGETDTVPAFVADVDGETLEVTVADAAADKEDVLDEEAIPEADAVTDGELKTETVALEEAVADNDAVAEADADVEFV